MRYIGNPQAAFFEGYLGKGPVLPWVLGQYVDEQTLTDAATILWDFPSQQAAKVTLGGNRTLGSITNPKVGAWMSLRVINGASWTLAYHANYDWGVAGAPVITTGAGKFDVISIYIATATKFVASIVKGYGP